MNFAFHSLALLLVAAASPAEEEIENPRRPPPGNQKHALDAQTVASISASPHVAPRDLDFVAALELTLRHEVERFFGKRDPEQPTLLGGRAEFPVKLDDLLDMTLPGNPRDELVGRRRAAPRQSEPACAVRRKDTAEGLEDGQKLDDRATVFALRSGDIGELQSVARELHCQNHPLPLFSLVLESLVILEAENVQLVADLLE